MSNHNPNAVDPREIEGEMPDWKKLRLGIEMVRSMNNNDDYSDPEKVVKVPCQKK